MHLFQVDIGEILPVLNFKELSIAGVLLGIIFYLIKEKTALKNEIKAKDNKIDEIALKYYTLLKDGKADTAQMLNRYENLLQDVLRVKTVSYGKKTETTRE
ncbi:hypothetical protein SAMN04487907_101270 [Zunongwangia mangrovi]|uniref:Uncharacterized protein n=1 Tax=Zunongwangia mangrovi TaxID=1334022 RepID=A0A1I1DDP8_9FLAO|nr:hypothetical protein [Zunongwangia mangrovi]SFB72506.1 hypothetical protein SAMN04487907_101270 [Zunongwangia mangrovi]